jgi:hypothetical protein
MHGRPDTYPRTSPEDYHVVRFTQKAATCEAPGSFGFIFMKEVLHDRSCQWVST